MWYTGTQGHLQYLNILWTVSICEGFSSYLVKIVVMISYICRGFFLITVSNFITISHYYIVNICNFVIVDNDLLSVKVNFVSPTQRRKILADVIGGEILKGGRKRKTRKKKGERQKIRAIYKLKC